MKNTVLAILLTAFCGAALHAAPSFTLLPLDGNVGGPPGSIVGWGFMVTDTDDYVFLTGSDFFPSTYSYGAYQDHLASSLVSAGPSPYSSSVSESFDASSQQGVGEFEIDGTAFAGAVTSGTLDVYYTEFAQDPLTCSSSCDPIVPDGTWSYSVNIKVTPEPAAALLTAAGLLLLWRFRPGRTREPLS